MNAVPSKARTATPPTIGRTEEEEGGALAAVGAAEGAAEGASLGAPLGAADGEARAGKRSSKASFIMDFIMQISVVKLPPLSF